MIFKDNTPNTAAKKAEQLNSEHSVSQSDFFIIIYITTAKRQQKYFSFLFFDAKMEP